MIWHAEVKLLKSLVRNLVDPGRSLGHTDRALGLAAMKGKDAKVEEEEKNEMKKKEMKKTEETKETKEEEEEGIASTEHRKGQAQPVQHGAQGDEVGGNKHCEDCQ